MKSTTESIALLIVIIVGLFTYVETESLTVSFQSSITALIILIGLAIVYRVYKKKKIRESGIEDIDKMDGFQFERYLSELFHRHGYKVKVTPKSSDFGVDLLLKKDKGKIAVQAKRYKNKVGIKAVQEVKAGMDFYEADKAWVVTNSYFTSSAKNLAKKTNVRLIDRNELMIWMRKTKKLTDSDVV